MRHALLAIFAFCFTIGCSASVLPPKPTVHVLVMAELHDMHAPFVNAAKPWLANLATQENFDLTYIENADPINQAYLSHYQLILQLNHPPYRWSDTAKAALQKYIEEGKGGWIGLHHAALLGDFDGFHVWPWYDDHLMGGIIWKAYIPTFAAGTVHVEDPAHPLMRNLPLTFTIKKEEWYTWTKSPRAGVHVLANVDESTYVPPSKVKMGDHPIIWTNDKLKARNAYLFMGHSPVLFEDENFKQLLKNAILWGGGRT